MQVASPEAEQGVEPGSRSIQGDDTAGEALFRASVPLGQRRFSLDTASDQVHVPAGVQVRGETVTLVVFGAHPGPERAEAENGN